MLLLVIIIIASAVLLKWFYNIKAFNAHLKHIPGPKPIPLLGNALDVINTSSILPLLEKWREEFGDNLFKVSMGPDKEKLAVSNYDFVEMVLSSSKIIDKASNYNKLHRWLGLGLLTSTGAKWQSKRKLLTPAFHFKILENFLDVFHKKTDILVTSMRSKLGSDSFDVYEYISLSTLDVICESAMGININAQLQSSSKYVKSVKEMGRIVFARAIHPLKQFDFFHRFSRDYRKETDALKVLHNTTDDVIRKKKLSRCYEEIAIKYDDGTKKKMAFLDLLLQATTPEGESLSDAEIREEVDTFMFEGHDTTAAAISFALYALSKHPYIQTKVFEEIRQILGDGPSKAPTYSDLQEMKYLEAVISETLRLYPSVPIIGRELTEDIEYDGHIYPKGLEMYMSPFGMHRSRQNFPDPLKFDPERFNLENKTSRKPYSYIPFSAGPRNCIGQKFAMLEMKSTISKVLRHYQILEVPGFEPELVAEVTLKSLNGVQIKISERIY